MTYHYNTFIAVDWSGARSGNTKGIAVAVATMADNNVVLVSPPEKKYWRRIDVYNFIQQQAISGNALIGIDCAFSLPFERSSKYFLDDTPHVFDLWCKVDDECLSFSQFDNADFYAEAFWRGENYGADFWVRGKRPQNFMEGEEPHRETEIAAKQQGLGAPESPYKLIGARQVGKGGLAGMRMMYRLQNEQKDQMGFWPFQALGLHPIVMMEIFPRLFLKKTGFGSRKIREVSALNDALDYYGCIYHSDGGKISDHESDAVVSAAGMKDIYLNKAELFSRDCLSKRAKSYEGWILGVEPEKR